MAFLFSEKQVHDAVSIGFSVLHGIAVNFVLRDIPASPSASNRSHAWRYAGVCPFGFALRLVQKGMRMVQTTLTLFGASAAIAGATIFVCRPVLVRAIDAMRSSELPISRVIFIGLWALAAVAIVLWVVSTAAVTLHSQGEPTSQSHASSQKTRVETLALPPSVLNAVAIGHS
jgi:hypothetical protein